MLIYNNIYRVILPSPWRAVLPRYGAMATGSVTLLRRGSGEGPFDNDAAQIKLSKDGKEYVMDSKAGKASWSGYSTIARGIIISDELLVERTLSLSSNEVGEKTGFQRQYILLSQMPQSASWEGV
jgi:hypothetical protein